jgi:hypothetical protein
MTTGRINQVATIEIQYHTLSIGKAAAEATNIPKNTASNKIPPKRNGN